MNKKGKKPESSTGSLSEFFAGGFPIGKICCAQVSGERRWPAIRSARRVEERLLR